MPFNFSSYPSQCVNTACYSDTLKNVSIPCTPVESLYHKLNAHTNFYTGGSWDINHVEPTWFSFVWLSCVDLQKTEFMFHYSNDLTYFQFSGVSSRIYSPNFWSRRWTQICLNRRKTFRKFGKRAFINDVTQFGIFWPPSATLSCPFLLHLHRVNTNPLALFMTRHFWKF